MYSPKTVTCICMINCREIQKDPNQNHGSSSCKTYGFYEKNAYPHCHHVLEHNSYNNNNNWANGSFLHGWLPQ